MGTVVVGVILVGIVALIVRSMIRDKKSGKSLQCGGECKNCGGHCGNKNAAFGGVRNCQRIPEQGN